MTFLLLEDGVRPRRTIAKWVLVNKSLFLIQEIVPAEHGKYVQIYSLGFHFMLILIGLNSAIKDFKQKFQIAAHISIWINDGIQLIQWLCWMLWRNIYFVWYHNIMIYLHLVPWTPSCHSHLCCLMRMCMARRCTNPKMCYVQISAMIFTYELKTPQSDSASHRVST